MDKLTVSLTGDNYTQHQKAEMWLDIHIRARCPQCAAIGSMLQGPRGGLAENIKCSSCHMVFWTTPFYGFGAYPIRDDTPTPQQPQAPANLSSQAPLCLDHNKEVKP